MNAPVVVLALSGLRRLARRRTNLLLAGILFWLLIAVSCSLRVTGSSFVNGRVVPIAAGDRVVLGIGTAYAGLHLVGFLVILFVLAPAIVGEVESGLASWTLVGPVRRRTFLAGRLLGAFLYTAALAALVGAGLATLLARYGGGAGAGPLAGLAVLLLLFAEYLALAVAFGMAFGSGMGGILLVLLSGAGAVVNTDALTRRFLTGGAVEGSAGVIDFLLGSALGGPPSAPARAAYGVLYALLPPSGNLQDLAVSIAAGRPLGVGLDAVSAPCAAVIAAAAFFAAARALERRDLP